MYDGFGNKVMLIQATIGVDKALAPDETLMKLCAQHGVVTAMVPNDVFHSLCLARAVEVQMAAVGVAATSTGVRVVRQPKGPYIAIDYSGGIYDVEWGD